MSHFVVYVIVPRDPSSTALQSNGDAAEQLEKEVDRLLAPYSENMQVPGYETDCYCVGSAAMRRTREQAEAELPRAALQARRKALLPPELHDKGLFSDDLSKEQYAQLEEADRQVAELWRQTWDRIAAKQPDKDTPSPDCSECQGSGKLMTTRNPASKWDWYVIGGRWNGLIRGQQRSDDDGGFNFGDEFRQLPDNMELASVLASQEGDDWVPYAIVTPDGEWHQKGEMGWFGMASNEMKRDDWRVVARQLMQQHAQHVVVSVDCHI